MIVLYFNQSIKALTGKRSYKSSSTLLKLSFRDVPSKVRYGKWGGNNNDRRNNDNDNDNDNDNNSNGRIRESGVGREYIPREGSSRSSYNDRNSDSRPSIPRSGSYDDRPSFPRSGGYNDRPSSPRGGGYNDRPSSPRGGGYNDRSSSYDRPKERWMEERENKGPPVYGYYEGDHLYGIAPVLAAIQSNKRNVTELITQEGMDPSNKKDEKAASQILTLAKEKGIKIREFPKHDLNMMTDNRPHQGFVLRAEPLEMKPLNALEPTTEFKCVLALDEVWDPQNFGALLRSCHFLGVDGVVVCAKNSAPLSPVVSKASAGALEIMDVLSTANMMRFLDKSIENGWQVIGTSLDEGSIDLKDTPLEKPTIVVLGNEGHGVRTNILKRCTQLVNIPGGFDSSVVDSLNVSVTGGIILHHIISSKKK